MSDRPIPTATEARLIDGQNPPPLPPPPPARGRDRELWVGLFVLLGIVSVLVALFTLTDASTFRGRYEINTLVGDAGGIRRGDPVQLLGVNIGRVKKFKIVPEGVQIRLEIEGEYRVPSDSHIELVSNGLLGGVTAEVIPGTSKDELQGGETVPGRQEAGLLDVVGGLSARADTVLGRVQQALSPQTVSNINASTADLRAMLRELTALTVEQRKSLNQLTTSLNRSAGGLERATANAEKLTGSSELTRTVARLDQMSAQLTEVAASLNRTSQTAERLATGVERGNGSLGKLMRDDSLYTNLSESARSLRQLTDDIKANPKRYINLKIF